MENILDRNNSAHIRSYEGIRDIIFKKKKGKKDFRNNASSNISQNQTQQPSHNVQKSNQSNPSVTHVKKGKAKFKDINTYQEKKKQKEGLLLQFLSNKLNFCKHMFYFIGRTPCDCVGQEHEFMNNCLVCGRIHCMEEGPGPCLFCGNMVRYD